MSAQFDLQGVGYIGLGEYYNSWLYRVRRHVFFRKIKAIGLDFANIDILDVGSGTGFYIERWSDLGGQNIVGVDLTQIAVERLKEKYPKYKFYQIDIGNDVQPIAHQSYDVISAFDILFHIVDDRQYEQAIDNIYSLLKPGGFFVFSENFLHTSVTTSPHQVGRTLKSIEYLLTKSGFKILERSPMFFLMNTPVDSDNVAINALWRINRSLISRVNLTGWMIGGLLFPFELLLTRLMKESPTTEIMICRKPVYDTAQ